MLKLCSLNEVDKPSFVFGQTEIWYMKPEYFQKSLLGSVPDPDNLEETHIIVGKVEERRLEAIYWMMQGEVWSPNGEANEFLEEKGLIHTSMCVGDVVKIGNKVNVATSIGWKELTAGEKNEDKA